MKANLPFLGYEIKHKQKLLSVLSLDSWNIAPFRNKMETSEFIAKLSILWFQS